MPSQAKMPSSHVCSEFDSGFPHVLNQEPPRTQQLSLPVRLVAHFEHLGLAFISFSLSTFSHVMTTQPIKKISARNIEMAAFGMCAHLSSAAHVHSVQPRLQQLGDSTLAPLFLRFYLSCQRGWRKSTGTDTHPGGDIVRS